MNRYKFDKEINKYGSIISTSNNGLSFICKKNIAQEEQDEIKYGEVHLTVMSMFGFRYIKTIDIFEKYKEISSKLNIHTWFDDAI